MYGQPLTARQNEILEMIKDLLTNSMIANRIGYSESLVRRETIIIYAKLGVRGRKDIVNRATGTSNISNRTGDFKSSELLRQSGT
jgi:DNA-binding CsgD family transcriptional regulator